ncbi:hypothetical protein SAMN02745172_01522 [Pseudoxanthobacter soli DSM 19599]|uniref:DUF1223 domain-containing protein n=1 Tax=Pseudoxanthobacter soli DSM 19599 TaxID=1123029 RepID=A0A1M7ZFK5_9HYPH|nr:DUF1223 domain-containing protein [Pseudoxanthobacter soli]SHO63654.1 hypothetical protein SAMN02745172_01522 [Pseudoxanthobacter soli DSM 19599]
MGVGEGAGTKRRARRGSFALISRRLLAKGLLASGILAVAATLQVAPARAGGGNNGNVSEPARAVVELFTSQGCAACPPADHSIGRYADDPSVVALTYPVDYWDYLGWTDTLASRVNSARQFAYANGRGDRSIYTPQLVIDGNGVLVGGDDVALGRRVAQAVSSDVLPVAISIRASDEAVHIHVAAATPGTPVAPATVWLVSMLPSVSVMVHGGENDGRELFYRNVVRGIRAIGMWNGSAIEIDLPVSEIDEKGDLPADMPGTATEGDRPGKASRCAVLLQADVDGKPGRIIGASWTEIDAATRGGDMSTGPVMAR